MFGSMAESHHVHQETDHTNPPLTTVINTSSTTGEGETSVTAGETVKDEGDDQQNQAATGEASPDTMMSKTS